MEKHVSAIYFGIWKHFCGAVDHPTVTKGIQDWTHSVGELPLMKKKRISTFFPKDIKDFSYFNIIKLVHTSEINTSN